MSTDHDRVEAHLDDLGRALSAVTPAPAPRRARRRPLIATGLALATAGVAGVVVIAVSPGGTPVDVLGRAEAALASRGELVHYVVEQRSGPATGDGADTRVAAGACAARRIEVWQAAEPSRWRILVPAFVRGVGCGADTTTTQGARHADPASETAWADGTQSAYDHGGRVLHVTTGYAPDGVVSRVPTGVATPQGTGEPIAELRGMLRRGELHDAGERTVDGRRVRSFSATSTDGVRLGDGRVQRFPRLVVYDVDATSYAPVRSLSSYVLPTPGRGSAGSVGAPGSRVRGARRFVDQLDFTAYDRRPLDAAARALLVIHPPAGTTVVRLTHDEVLRRARRSSPRPVVRP